MNEILGFLLISLQAGVCGSSCNYLYTCTIQASQGTGAQGPPVCLLS